MSEAKSAEKNLNMAMVRGVLSSDPKSRELPSASVVWNYEIATIGPDGQRCSVPIAWMDPSRPSALRAGDEVVAVGLVRRRFFRTGGATQSRTELLAEVVARAGSARASKALSLFARRASVG